MRTLVKDWSYVQLDSGHWVAICGDLESPIACHKAWVKAWVKSFCSGKTVFV
jgi:hypothetical protein